MVLDLGGLDGQLISLSWENTNVHLVFRRQRRGEVCAKPCGAWQSSSLLVCNLTLTRIYLEKIIRPPFVYISSPKQKENIYGPRGKFASILQYIPPNFVIVSELISIIN